MRPYARVSTSALLITRLLCAVIVATLVLSAPVQGAANILVLVDANTAGTTALVAALTAAGNTVTARTPPENTWNTTDPPLTGFNCVVHLDGATPFVSLSVTAQTALESFVSSGGGFIAEQWDGFERATGIQINMNNLVLLNWADGATDNCGGCSMTYTTVPALAGHPVLTGVPSPFTFFADGHDAGSQVVYGVSPSTVLMRAPSGGPAVLVRQFGSGRVVNFSHAANFNLTGLTLQDANIKKLYVNAVGWACNGAFVSAGCGHHLVHGHISTVPATHSGTFGQHHGTHGHTVAAGADCPPHAPGHSVVMPEPEAEQFAAAGPTRRGAALELFGPAAGLFLGDDDNQDAVGFMAPASGSPLFYTTSVPEVRIAGVSARVLFSGMAPGQRGTWQINVVVPDEVPAGKVPVTISYEGDELRSADIVVE